MKAILVLNPFSYNLGKRDTDIFYNITGKRCLYKSRNVKAFKMSDKHYITCMDNIIITETTGIPKGLIDAVSCRIRPKGYGTVTDTTECLKPTITAARLQMRIILK